MMMMMMIVLTIIMTMMMRMMTALTTKMSAIAARWLHAEGTESRREAPPFCVEFSDRVVQRGKILA